MAGGFAKDGAQPFRVYAIVSIASQNWTRKTRNRVATIAVAARTVSCDKRSSQVTT